MNIDEAREQDERCQEAFCDLLAEMTPELQRVSVVILQAVWGRDERGAALRDALAALGNLSNEELRGMVAQLQEQGAMA